MSHSELEASCLRPPGVPATLCPGELVLVETATDSAQAGEGAVGEDVETRRYRCEWCHETVVTARLADGRIKLRNSWRKTETSTPREEVAIHG